MTDNNIKAVVSREQDLSLPVGLEPSFKLSAGTKSELELNGYAISPFTGQLLVGTAEYPRAATLEEFQEAAKKAARRETEMPNKGTSFAQPGEVAKSVSKRVARD